MYKVRKFVFGVGFVATLMMTGSAFAADMIRYENEVITDSGNFAGCTLNFIGATQNFKDGGATVAFSGSISHLLYDKMPMTLIKLVGIDPASVGTKDLKKTPMNGVYLKLADDMVKYERGRNKCDPGSVCTIYGDSELKSFISVLEAFEQYAPGKFTNQVGFAISAKPGSMDIPISIPATVNSNPMNASELYKFNNCQMDIVKKITGK